MKIAGKLNCWSTYIVKDDTFFLSFMRKNLVGALETSVVMHLQNLWLQPKKYCNTLQKKESKYCRFCHLKPC